MVGTPAFLSGLLLTRRTPVDHQEARDVTSSAVLHTIGAVAAIAAATILAALGHLDATAAVAVIVAAAGIGSTGVAGSAPSSSPALVQPAAASPVTAVRTPAATP